MRSGAGIALVVGMINYAIEQNHIRDEYACEYTNASWIVGDDYSLTDGLFAGFDPARWAFALDNKGEPRRDPTLKIGLYPKWAWT